MNKTETLAKEEFKERAYSDIKDWLTETSQVVQDGAMQGFDILVRKQFWVDGVMTSVLGVVFLIISVIGFIYSIKLLRKVLRGDVNDEFEPLSVVILGCCIIGVIMSVLAIVSGIPNMMIPEYYAIMEIIDKVK